MFSQKTLRKLQIGFKKGKIKGLAGINPKRLALIFGKPINEFGMKISTARVQLDRKEICSFGFGKIPHHLYDLMFTIAPNPQGYNLSQVNQKLKSLKVQASLLSGQLLLMVYLRDSKSFFSCMNKLIQATAVVS